ncbi:membrane protein required for colicin V production [Desulfacinum hydrothermale DSM 13146]|uniref:Membrane protein required for colicin V production n=1 Tax=Desulfacinum hydrothermale DSM 13146 TaxID=1121390 RepID=A0A1W1X378_9BACT|nr:CvpA family protein [Desulfacinum hydrothermale]SMC17861.1 membrane protein required for colicin V production [Desulfacinum hydrothermale DSM 13146]
MNGLDWVLAAVGILCVARGLWRGAVSQVFGIVGVVGGFYLAGSYCGAVGARIAQAFGSLPQPVMVAFVLLFVLTWIVLGLTGAWLSRLIQESPAGWLDRLFGGALGFAKGLVAAVLMVSFLTLFLPATSPLLRESRLTPYVLQAARLAVSATPKNLQEKFDRNRRKLYKHWAHRREA